MTRKAHGDAPAFLGNEGARILDEVGDDLANAEIVAVDHERGLCARFPVNRIVDRHAFLFGAYLAGYVHQTLHQNIEIERRGVGARQLGIEPRRIRNVADQAV
ncbi:hypothetical protein D3C86_2015680 [compost metagenome]